ncbi:hypothetical protein E3T54_02775 [Cryobacterium sp. Sr8]|uniref:hypothetical protein n=1 Tax=Cryobacterium sp. Sr8 TaxID=1259203 RepID=UPI0010692A85|nr:hypothetical protein [Cryobacterium sp. Sr8]TFD80683.1 hypothetical protein E3T54_02775 [Cryobacterium sp. Sr8]
MNNSDYFSRLDRFDGLDTRGPEPRYRAIVEIRPAPSAPSWSRKLTALAFIPPLVLMLLAISLLITDLVVR